MFAFLPFFFFHFCLESVFCHSLNPLRPNIILFLLDDWGWNDFSFSNSTNIITPNLEKYKENGLYLFKHYAMHLCTPSRATLLSGKYAARIGMQHMIWQGGDTWAIPNNLVLLPERLKALGYTTHMIGKWHLGYPSWRDVPMQRGFDSFLGYLNGGETYYHKNTTCEFNGTDYSGADFRRNNDPYLDLRYSTWVYGNRTMEIIDENLETDEPLFMYAAFQAIHDPVEAPEEYFEYFENCGQSTTRCEVTAEAFVMDEVFGKIMTQIENNNMWENTLILVMSDNGGSVTSATEIHGNNWPLRGNKGTFWEGGFRTQAFVTGGVLPNNRRHQMIDNLFHISDWYPTILSIINDNEFLHQYDFDGIDQKNTILYDEKSNREELLLNIDQYECSYEYCAAVIYKNFKLAQGDYVAMSMTLEDGWTPLLNQDKLGTPTVNCGTSQPDTNVTIDYTVCPWNGEACLYNLDADPCEQRDVKDEYPEMYEYLLERFEYYNSTSVEPLPERFPDREVKEADPKNFGGWWTPWQDKLEDVLEDITINQQSTNSWSLYNFISQLLLIEW